VEYPFKKTMKIALFIFFNCYCKQRSSCCHSKHHIHIFVLVESKGMDMSESGFLTKLLVIFLIPCPINLAHKKW